MRYLRPTAWTVLQVVLLETRTENGRLVSHTAARRVSAELGMDVSTAARALRLPRSRGLLVRPHPVPTGHTRWPTRRRR